MLHLRLWREDRVAQPWRQLSGRKRGTGVLGHT